MASLLILLQAFVATSIFFVWVVRYDNIVREFKEYGLPPAVRDLVGILKLFFALLLLIGIWRSHFALIGAAGIAVLMACAVVTHLRVRNPAFKLAPSFSLMVIALAIAVMNWPGESEANDSLLTFL